MRRRLLFLVAILALAGAASPAHAVWFWGTKPLGMGTAYTGVADDNNAIQVNPAGIGRISYYSIDINYERREYEIQDYAKLHEDDLVEEEDEFDFGREFFQENQPEEDVHEKNISDFWHASIVDGKTTRNVALGVAFTAANFPARTFNEGKDYRFHLALAGNFSDIVYLGAAGKVIQLEPGDTQFNGDFGFLVHAVDFLSIGLAGRNVFGSGDPYLVEREVALGLAGWILDYATVSFDMTKVFDVDESNTFNFATGAEGYIYKMASTRSGLALRGGFLWDQIYARNNYSAGFAWIAPEGTLAYTFQGDVENVRNFKHSIEIALRF
ncbi:MAG: hypothetical protein M5R36_01690 [Deltaproteobacteria bacterium]|nr:hypothetical protein [Deltaproteobacteria bacterium]